MRALGDTPIQCDWWPLRRRDEDADTQREEHVEREKTAIYKPRGELSAENNPAYTLIFGFWPTEL